MGGLKFFRQIVHGNHEAAAAEFDSLLEEETREGISLRDWRTLPDSPTAQPELLYGRSDDVETVEVEKASETFVTEDGTVVPRDSVVEVGDTLVVKNPTKFGRSSIGRRRVPRKDT